MVAVVVREWVREGGPGYLQTAAFLELMAAATQSGKVGLGVGVVVRDGVSKGVRVTVGFWGSVG